MKLEKIAYGGWDNCLRLTDDKVELIITLDVGPRVIRYGFVDGQNMFKNFDDQVGKTGGDEWRSYGGHRLWHAPEVIPRTYYPDNNPVEHEWDGKTLTLTPPPETANGLQLSVEITPEADGNLLLVHKVKNVSNFGIEVAPWCLSVMAAGGRGIFPHEDFRPHPDCVTPSRPLVLWYFTDMSDPRWTWGEKYVQLQQDDSQPSKQKTGAADTKGWAAYVLGDDVFIKRYGFDPSATYPDLGCNVEMYTEPGFLEVESLGPLTCIEPGASVSHPERWGLYKANTDFTDDSITANILPLVDKTTGV